MESRINYELLIGTKVGDLEWPWTLYGRYIALFHWIW